MKNNKQKTTCKETLNGLTVHNVALNKSGIPQLGERLGFMTIGRESGSVRDRSKKPKE